MLFGKPKVVDAVSRPGAKFNRFSKMTIGSRLALLFIALLVVVAVAAPVISPEDPLAITVSYQSPTAEHLFGTDNVGRDVMTACSTAHGIRSSSACCPSCSPWCWARSSARSRPWPARGSRKSSCASSTCSCPCRASPSPPCSSRSSASPCSASSQHRHPVRAADRPHRAREHHQRVRQGLRARGHRLRRPRPVDSLQACDAQHSRPGYGVHHPVRRRRDRVRASLSFINLAFRSRPRRGATSCPPPRKA